MTVSITRSGGRGAPPDRERLEIEDDGAFTMWRSVRSPVVGRFAGRLPEATLSKVGQLAAAAAAAVVPAVKRIPGAAAETIEVDGATLRAGSTGGPDGPWGELQAALRPLLRELTSSPSAAVALEVGENRASARLAHRGDAPLVVDLSSLTVRSVVWRPGWEQGGEWSSDAADQRVETGPGWAHDLPFGHGLDVGPTDALHVFASLGLLDRETKVAALASVDPSPSG